jgi:hypothetical protein
MLSFLLLGGTLSEVLEDELVLAIPISRPTDATCDRFLFL